MITSVEVFLKIREMIRHRLNPQHRVLLNDLIAEFSITQDSLLVILAELNHRGLTKFHNTAIMSVSFTNYGVAIANLPDDFISEDR